MCCILGCSCSQCVKANGVSKHADHLLFELIYALHVRETLVLIILEVMILPLARSKHHGLMCTKSQRKQMILGFG